MLTEAIIPLNINIADFSEAIRLNPKDAISISNRGRAYARTGDYDRAIADFEAAAKLAP